MAKLIRLRQCSVLNANGLKINVSLNCPLLLWLWSSRSVEMKHVKIIRRNPVFNSGWPFGIICLNHSTTIIHWISDCWESILSEAKESLGNDDQLRIQMDLDQMSL